MKKNNNKNKNKKVMGIFLDGATYTLKIISYNLNKYT